jgi:hypothetical protein
LFFSINFFFIFYFSFSFSKIFSLFYLFQIYHHFFFYENGEKSGCNEFQTVVFVVFQIKNKELLIELENLETTEKVIEYY